LKKEKVDQKKKRGIKKIKKKKRKQRSRQKIYKNIVK
jgi:hypothetical protein